MQALCCFSYAVFHEKLVSPSSAYSRTVLAAAACALAHSSSLHVEALTWLLPHCLCVPPPRRLGVPGSVEPFVCVSLSRVIKHVGFQSVSGGEQWCIDWCQWVGGRVSDSPEIPSHVQHRALCLHCVYVFIYDRSRSHNWPEEACLMRMLKKRRRRRAYNHVYPESYEDTSLYVMRGIDHLN